MKEDGVGGVRGGCNKNNVLELRTSTVLQTFGQ